MAAFVYYLPRFSKPIVTPADLPDLADLPQTLKGATWANAETAGPDNGSGVVIAPEPAQAGGVQGECGFFADRQTWKPIDPARLWIGWQHNDRPTPEDLRRPSIVDGHPVTLGDRKTWLIPAVHAPRTRLPCVMEFDANQSPQWQPKPLPEYQAVMDEVAKWFQLVNSDRPGYQYDDWCRYATQLLAVNYRVGPVECSILGLYRTSPEIMEGLIAASLDYPALLAEIEAQKKTIIPGDS